ncbi:hypothetical protein [Castellaniella sp.]|uniref:hypothetical protein n=1 Tax=Castellaniella sp. TaxID=1955812 RepID=UPI002AFE67D9|nr:hypothetical protein [Castellaniella sp.]
MTISSDVRKAGPFDGNDATTVFPYAFVVFSTAELLVIHTDSAGVESALTSGSDYTATMNPDQNSSPGGDVTLPAPLPTDEKITITSALAYLQTLDLANQGGFYPDVIERALDRIVVLCQQNAEQLSRSIKIGISDDTPADEYRDSLLQAARDAVAAASAAATSESNAHDSEVAAALSESHAATSETNAATSASQALASKNAVASSETNAGDSASAAGAAAGVATSARDTAVAAASAASTSETNAATSEANAATSASSASDSADRAEAVPATAPWMSIPIGTPFPIVGGAPVPPTDNPAFRYVLLTAGQTGAGGYNEGVLTSETVTGTSPLIEATATVNLAGSPMNGQLLHLINTEGRFVGAGAVEAVENDMFQGHEHTQYAVRNGSQGWSNNGGLLDVQYTTPTTGILSSATYGTPRIGDHTQPRAHRVPHYMRIK